MSSGLRGRPGPDEATNSSLGETESDRSVRIDVGTHEDLERLAAELDITVGKTVSVAVRAPVPCSTFSPSCAASVPGGL